MIEAIITTDRQNGEGEVVESEQSTTSDSINDDIDDSDADKTNAITTTFLVVVLFLILLMVCVGLYFVTKRKTTKIAMVPSKSVDSSVMQKDKKAEQQPSGTMIDTELMNMEESIDDDVVNNNDNIQCDEFIVEDEEDEFGTLGNDVTPMQSMDVEGDGIFAAAMANDDDAIMEDLDVTDEGDTDDNDDNDGIFVDDLMTAGNEENEKDTLK